MIETTDQLLITAATYDDELAHVKYVFVGLPPNGGADRTMEGMRLYQRERLIEAMHKGMQFRVAYRHEDAWQIEGEVRLCQIDGIEYLRLDDEPLPIDDLGNLAKIRASH
jgi:hypothetical protein